MRVDRFLRRHIHVIFEATDEPAAIVFNNGIVEVHPAGRDNDRAAVVLTWPSVLDLQRWLDGLVGELNRAVE